jgi:hypothetical protein
MFPSSSMLRELTLIQVYTLTFYHQPFGYNLGFNVVFVNSLDHTLSTYF